MAETKSEIILRKIPNLNVIVIEKTEGSRFFLSTKQAFVISIPNFSFLLKSLIDYGYISPKVLSGILEEYYSNK